MNRSKRELERLKRIAKREGVWDDQRFRDQIALLEVDIVALEMLVLRVLSAEKSGKNSLDIAGLLKIKGSEIQQRYAELMMLAAGPFALPFIEEAMEAGWQGDFPGGEAANARWHPRISTCARPPFMVAAMKCSATSWRRLSSAEASGSPRGARQDCSPCPLRGGFQQTSLNVNGAQAPQQVSTRSKEHGFDFSDDQQSLRDAVRPGGQGATPSSAAAASSPQGL